MAGALPAGAVSGVAVQADRTWGTSVSDGHAELVHALAAKGGRAFLGGAFTTMVGPDGAGAEPRAHLAAVDLAGGNLSDWAPGADKTVWALALSPDGQRLYVGGDFSRVGGGKRAKVAVVDTGTGEVISSFRAGVSGRVRALALSPDGRFLYVGGDFTKVSGIKRAGVAALDAATGGLIANFNPPANGGGRYTGQMGDRTEDGRPGNVNALAVSNDGRELYVGGSFLRLGDQSGIVSLDAATGQKLPSQFKMDRPVNALATAPSGDRVYAAAGGPGGRGFAFRAGTVNPVWTAKVDGDAVGVAASASTIYLMGHYDYIVPSGSSCYKRCPNGTGRRHLAAFTAADGALRPWNPTANTSTGPYPAAVTDGWLLVGGEFTTINGRAQPGYAQFPGTP